MKAEEIKYKLFDKDKSSQIFIYDILHSTNNDFIPALSSKVDIQGISKKFASLASVIIAFVDNIPVGLVAYYNNPAPNFSYLSIICVKKEFRGYGIGRNLEIKCLNNCKNFNSSGLTLNMRVSNQKLLKSRLELGYKIVKEYKSHYGSDVLADLEYLF